MLLLVLRTLFVQFRWQPFSHSPAFGPMSLPQGSSPGLLCLKHLKQHLTPPSVLLSPITLLGSSAYLLIENLVKFWVYCLPPSPERQTRRARSSLHGSLDLKASYIVDAQKDLLREWQCVSTGVPGIEAELLVLKSHRMWAGHVLPSCDRPTS